MKKIKATPENVAFYTNEKLWTVAEVAEFLGVSQHTIRRWMMLKKIPYLKINGVIRFKPAAIVEQFTLLGF